MRRANDRGLSPGWQRLAVAIVGVAGVAGAAGCTDADDACSGKAETFAVFAPAATVSAIPLCTNVGTVDASFEQFIDGGTFEAFPGASSLPPAAVSECATLCSLATTTLPCCRSVWEPDTVLCTPQCQPP